MFTPSIVSKIIAETDVEHPPSQREITRTCRVSQSTVSRIIKSAIFVLHKKCTVHKLTPLNVGKRRPRAFRLYRQLVNHLYKKFVTTDESWFYLDSTKG